MSALEMDDIPADFPVRPIAIPALYQGVLAGRGAQRNVATCGECGLSWDDTIPTAYTPAPGGRCPFEAFHKMNDADREIDEPVTVDEAFEVVARFIDAAAGTLGAVDEYELLVRVNEYVWNLTKRLWT